MQVLGVPWEAVGVPWEGGSWEGGWSTLGEYIGRGVGVPWETIALQDVAQMLHQKALKMLHQKALIKTKRATSITDIASN